jgi:hypothetical protein
MKRYSVLALPVALMVAIVAGPAAAHAQAQPFENDDFSIALPAGFSEFAIQEQTIDSPSGPIVQRTFVSKDETGAAMIVTYGEMPGTILDPEEMISGSRDSLVTSVGAQVESERSLDVDGATGRSILFAASSPTAIFARGDLMVTGPRLFQVIFLGFNQEQRAGDAVSSAFESFEIKPAAEAEAAADAEATDDPQGA